MIVTEAIPEYQIIAPKEALIAWRNDPITKQILDIVATEEINSSVRVGKGETLGENIEQDTARAVGYIEGIGFLADLLETKFIIEDKEDEDRNSKGKKSS